jgi:hypothetical protein
MSTALQSRSRGEYYIQTRATSNKLENATCALSIDGSETDQALRLDRLLAPVTAYDFHKVAFVPIWIMRLHGKLEAFVTGGGGPRCSHFPARLRRPAGP